MNYLDSNTHNTNERLFTHLEKGRRHILNFGYSLVAFRNELKKSFTILRKLLISSHG